MKKYIKGFYDYRFLFSELVQKGIRLKYRRSYLGIIWSLVEPIMTTIVLVIVFGTVMGESGKGYPLYILCGRLLYTFFSGATKGASRAIRSNASMIKKVYVPRYMYPLSCIAYNYIIMLISLIVIIPMMIYTRTVPHFQIWQVLPALVLILLITIGVGMILAVADVYFRDVEYLWNVATHMLFYISGIMYRTEKLAESGWGWIIKYNPLYSIIDIMRGAIFGYYSSAWNYGYSFVFSALSVIIGVVWFKKKQDDFILHI